MDVGIIGGADGPTAILVASGVPLWLYVALGATVAAAVLVIALLLKNRK